MLQTLLIRLLCLLCHPVGPGFLVCSLLIRSHVSLGEELRGAEAEW